MKAIGYFDGASRGNPGEAGAGCLLTDGGEAVWEKGESLGRATNNEAEYRALINLLTEARRRGAQELEARGDSRLVVCQIKREWKINKPHLAALAREAWELASGLRLTMSWVPREQNAAADALANEAIDKGSFERP